MKENYYAILTRQDITIWITKEEAIEVGKFLIKGTKFVTVRDRIVNTADIVGVYKQDDIYDRSMQKRGLWKGDNGKWYTKREEFWRDSYTPKGLEPISNNIKQIEQ